MESNRTSKSHNKIVKKYQTGHHKPFLKTKVCE